MGSDLSKRGNIRRAVLLIVDGPLPLRKEQELLEDHAREHGILREYQAWLGATKAFQEANPYIAQRYKQAYETARDIYYEALGDDAPTAAGSKATDETPPATPRRSKDDESVLDLTQPPALPPAKKREREEPKQPPELARLEADMDVMVRNGLSPFYNFVDMVAGLLGDKDVRPYYRYIEGGAPASLRERQSPIDKGAMSKDEFVSKNSHLGKPILVYALETMAVGKLEEARKRMLLGAEAVPSVVEDERAALDIVDHVFQAQGPDALENQWMFGALNEAVFKFVLAPATYGILYASYLKLKATYRHLTLKHLLLSNDVNWAFADFVRLGFLESAGGNAYGGRAHTSQGKIDGTNYMLSVGMDTRALIGAKAQWAFTWFADVRLVHNPQLAELEAFVATEARRNSELERGAANSGAQPAEYKDCSVADLRRGLHEQQAKQGHERNERLIRFLDSLINLRIAQEKLRYIPDKVLRHFE